jgi:hypothetical protein
MNHSRNHPPTSPRNGNGHKVSQRGLLSIAMLLVSVVALAISLLGGGQMVLKNLKEKPEANALPNPDPNAPVSQPENASAGLPAQMIVIGLAYVVGWLTAMIAIRVYGNLILPIIITWFTWGCLVAVCYLYIQILIRMYQQPDEITRFIKYMVTMAGTLGAMIGLHLILEDHDLRPFAIPILIISLIQLVMIVYRYVFASTGAHPGFLWKDLVFFFTMTGVSVSMLAHWGMLEPLRKQLANFFDRNSTSIRSDD